MLSSFVVSIADTRGVLEAKDTLAAKIVRMEDEIKDLTKRAEAALEADDEAAARAFLEKKQLGGAAWPWRCSEHCLSSDVFPWFPDVFLIHIEDENRRLSFGLNKPNRYPLQQSLETDMGKLKDWLGWIINQL